MSATPNCPNCGNITIASDQFCSQCGQKTALHRLTLSHLLHEVIHYLTHADKSIFSLVKQLAIRPGMVAREYIGGKRKSFFPPLNFFLIVAGLFVFMLSTFHQYRDTTNNKLNAQITQIKDPTKKQHLIKIQQRSQQANQFINKYSNFIQMIATPLIAGFYLLFFRRKSFNYTEHLVANLYFSGFNALVFALLITPLMNLAQSSTLYFASLACYFMFEWIYRSMAYYQFIGIKGTKAAIYCLTVSLSSVILWIILSGGLVTIFIATGFGIW